MFYIVYLHALFPFPLHLSSLLYLSPIPPSPPTPIHLPPPPSPSTFPLHLPPPPSPSPSTFLPSTFSLHPPSPSTIPLHHSPPPPPSTFPTATSLVHYWGVLLTYTYDFFLVWRGRGGGRELLLWWKQYMHIILDPAIFSIITYLHIACSKCDCGICNCNSGHQPVQV